MNPFKEQVSSLGGTSDVDPPDLFPCPADFQKWLIWADLAAVESRR